ncbi:MAG TPA: hypothetical protein VJC39_04220 [Candidatus Nanoarchaeia archaeon]|nr:hypothetical protein [Candidatus Nanoarchaeia archaeon]
MNIKHRISVLLEKYNSLSQDNLETHPAVLSGKQTYLEDYYGSDYGTTIG